MAQSIDNPPSQQVDHDPSSSSSSTTSATVIGSSSTSISNSDATPSTSTNGHHSNGKLIRNDAMDYEDAEEGGTVEGFTKPLWDGSDIDRREFVRIALQALEDIGYSATAKTLKEESGFTLESKDVTEFREGILHGKWETVEKLLQKLPIDAVSNITTVMFSIRQQKFLEALEGKDVKKGLSILRNELTPLNHDSDRLHLLSSLIMCSSAEDLRKRAGWDGVAGHSREQLLISLQQYISPTILLPRHRLGTLLSQAKSYQRSNCLFHASDSQISLLSDCNCDPSLFPTYTSFVLKDHTDEIWRLEFSHNGEWLATAGRDKMAIIWKVKAGFALDKMLVEHSDPVSCLAWSPDDTILLTAAEAEIKMWNTATGVCINTLTQHTYPVGALSWLPDGKGFVSGGMDSRLWFFDLAGNTSNPLPKSSSRVIDLAITPDGTRLVSVGRADLSPSSSISRGGSQAGSRSETPAPTPPVMAKHEKRISVFNLVEKKLEYEIVQPGELTSVSISEDSRFAIISHAPNEILYLDLRDGTILRRFQGHDQAQYVLQSCFGGALQNFVLSGSEDGKIYIWHRDTGVLVRVLSGHGLGSVNAVAWNKHSQMFASASDDRTVRVWTTSGAFHSTGSTWAIGKGKRVANP